MRLCYLLATAALAEDNWTPRDLDDATLRLIRHAGPFHASEQAKLAQLPARFSRCATQLAYFDVRVHAGIKFSRTPSTRRSVTDSCARRSTTPRPAATKGRRRVVVTIGRPFRSCCPIVVANLPQHEL